MTDPVDTVPAEPDLDPRIAALEQLRDAMRESPEVDWSGSDVAELLDRVLEPAPVDSPLDRYNQLIDGLANELDLDVLTTEHEVATVSVDYLNPLISRNALSQLAGLVAEGSYDCPVHGIPNCSPELNDCDVPATVRADFAVFIQSQANAE